MITSFQRAMRRGLQRSVSTPIPPGFKEEILALKLDTRTHNALMRGLGTGTIKATSIADLRQLTEDDYSPVFNLGQISIQRLMAALKREQAT